MIKKLFKIRGLLLACLLISSPFTAKAAILDVTSLSVDYVSVDLSVGSVVSTGASSAIVPPAELLMGSYQDPILGFSTSFSGGSFTGSVYSTGAFGAPAPSASVDTIAGNFTSVDLSSLRIDGMLSVDTIIGTTTYSFDTEFWPLVTTPTSSTYDDLTGAFSLTWAFSDMVMYDTSLLGSQSYSTDFDFTISGNAAVVPLPAAVWLFVSGLLALVGFTRQRR